jgi:hypothetical protein
MLDDSLLIDIVTYEEQSEWLLTDAKAKAFFNDQASNGLPIGELGGSRLIIGSLP